MFHFNRVAIVGVGLLGGAIGCALRESKLAQRVIGICRREETIEQAKQHGAIDEGTTNLTSGLREAEIVVVCTPVKTIAPFVLKILEAVPQKTLVTDAGSTKAAIELDIATGLKKISHTAPLPSPAIKNTPRASVFIGSHPLAGNHKTGFQNAHAALLQGKRVIITPSQSSPTWAVEKLTRFWNTMGASVHAMDAIEHDKLLAKTSHAPHMVAAALALATPSEALPFVASGWEDTTRVAAGSVELWKDIVATNRAPLLEALSRVESNLAAIREAVQSGDDSRLITLLEEAKRIRDALEH